MAARRVQLVADESHGKWRHGGRPVEALVDLGPRRPRIVDPRRDRHQLTGRSQLLDQGDGDPEARSQPLRRWRHRASLAQRVNEAIDTVAHDRIENGRAIRQPNSVPLAPQDPSRDHVVDHPSQIGVTQAERSLTAMAGGSRWLGRAQLGDEVVNAQVQSQRLSAMVPAQRCQEASRGETPLGGIDRSIAHGRARLS